MGYNATVVVMTDALHQIEQDKDFGRKLASAISLMAPYNPQGRPQYVSAGMHCNAAVAIELHHADDDAIVAVGNNTASVFGYVNNLSGQNQLSALKQLAERLGYSLRKKPNKTKAKTKS